MFTIECDHFYWVFLVLQSKKINFIISQFWKFLLRSGDAIFLKIWKSRKLLDFVPFIKKTHVNHVHNRIGSFRETFAILHWMKANFKISDIWIFLLRSGYVVLVNIWKSLKLLNSVPFIKRTRVYNRLWSFWLTFRVLQWMKTNFKISQFSRFLLRSGYAILVKIWKWWKLLNSVPFIKETRVNHVWNQIWSFWLSFTVL